MADKSLPDGNLSTSEADEITASGRRAFVRRAVVIGIPVVLATVRGRGVQAQTLSGSGSLVGSGQTGTSEIGQDYAQPVKPKKR